MKTRTPRPFLLVVIIMLFAMTILSACEKQDEAAAENAESNTLFTTPRERLSLDASDSPEWVTKLDAAKDAKQLFVVAGYERSTAWISMHEKDQDGSWKMIISTPGFIGKEGLGKTKEEQGGYNRLIDYSEQHMDDEVELDYFSVLNSDFVVFDGDVKQINYVNCCYMSALGYYGKGMKEKSDEFIEKGLAVDAAHPGLLFIKHIDERAPKMKEDDPTLLRPANWNTTK